MGGVIGEELQRKKQPLETQPDQFNWYKNLKQKEVYKLDELLLMWFTPLFSQRVELGVALKNAM